MLEPSRRGRPPVAAAGFSAHSATCPLPRCREAVGGARRFTRNTLRRWDLDDRFESVALVVSELVTNALRHGMPADGPPGLEPPVRLLLMSWTSKLVCAVRDPGAATVGTAFRLTPSCPDADAESGRGLCLVDAVSDGWGWHPLPGPPSGTVVWALFRLGRTGPVRPVGMT
ncbi:ATP-binding protein [Streptomyces sp. MTZ3.1]|uniref:ATP-binding protein n=1 Tax=Streptomyces meridianus TaxID=2938945 RepID=A0ABT0X551_9ACTN|nr:ATP-binding protein [Streptomyces meridianus]MCM2577663.1 ATP-binding protein [Streptomyces meridianus]